MHFRFYFDKQPTDRCNAMRLFVSHFSEKYLQIHVTFASIFLLKTFVQQFESFEMERRSWGVAYSLKGSSHRVNGLESQFGQFWPDIGTKYKRIDEFHWLTHLLKPLPWDKFRYVYCSYDSRFMYKLRIKLWTSTYLSRSSFCLNERQKMNSTRILNSKKW